MKKGGRSSRPPGSYCVFSLECWHPAELTYLAVRLAIVDLTLPEDEPCPIVLDDVLAGIDGARSARVLELLREIAEKRQVILFTCTEPASAQAEGE